MINNLELTAYIAHLHRFTPCMAPLEHISMGIDNTAAKIWDSQVIVSTTTSVGPLLRKSAWITRQAQIHASTSHIPGVKHVEVYAASLLTHLLVPAFLQQFRSTLPQPTPLRLSLFPSGVTPRLHMMLITKQSPTACPLQEYVGKIPHGNSGMPSVHVCTSPQTSKAAATRPPFYKYFITRSI